MSAEHNETGPPRPGTEASRDSPRMYKSSVLFEGQKELIIIHAQEKYRLRITRHDKLILTK